MSSVEQAEPEADERGAFTGKQLVLKVICVLRRQINTIHNKLQAFLKLLEFRIIGSAGGVTEARGC